MNKIKNPILPGFNPDPSIVRVGKDYYIATSTFEWFPGICIYHSNDLANWQLIAQPLSHVSQLDMRGTPDSCGVWAPCLSYNKGIFYLCFTNTKRFAGDFKDTPNYIVTATDVTGTWSEPTYINSSGFDPSLFIDEDGSAWFLNMLWDHRPRKGRNNWLPQKYFAGIMLQQIDLATLKLIGKRQNIFSGSSLGLSEGPHLYKRHGWYYLLLAEGGTGKDHACTFARSKRITGKYEVDPDGPILSSANAPINPIKRAGHGDWVEAANGDCYLVHLCSRPLPYRGRSVMGRETAIQPMVWNEHGWPRLESDQTTPLLSFLVSQQSLTPSRKTKQLLEFNGEPLPLDFQTLRMALPETTLSLLDRPGYLRLYGKESLGSLFHQALIARRQQAFCFTAQTKLDFQPQNFQQMAGLVCYYNSKKYYYLYITADDVGNRVLDVSMCLNDAHCKYPQADAILIPTHGEIELKVRVEYDLLRFYYRTDGELWQSIECVLDYSQLCDETGDGGADANFTGAFVGICCQDLSEQSQQADFGYFYYQEQPVCIDVIN